eukprot:811012-Amphidinium_carterae.3
MSKANTSVMTLKTRSCAAGTRTLVAYQTAPDMCMQDSRTPTFCMLMELLLSSGPAQWQD